MSRLEVILALLLLLSLVFNVVLFVYSRNVVMRLLQIADEIGDLRMMVTTFSKHIRSVYELEMFYGDTTLEYLLNHAVSFNEQLETFEYIYSLTEAEELETEGNPLDDDAENIEPEEN